MGIPVQQSDIPPGRIQAMRITKVYTRFGDKGGTSLVGGIKVRKDDLRIESYGTVDELSATVGISRAELHRSSFEDGVAERLDTQLATIQHDLFNLGADLATRKADRWEGMRLVEAEDTKRLENEIDAMNEDLSPLADFILPGGGPVGATLHLARTVCRRAERITVALADREDLGDQAVPFLNRLSDWLFVASRWIALQAGEREVLWQRDR
jgi:cob(I)alamin adenosyltransferase